MSAKNSQEQARDNNSQLMLIGIGGAGCAITRAVDANFGGGIRLLLADTDEASNANDSNGGKFLLLGGGRLYGHGSGGDHISAQMAAEDSLKDFESTVEGVRIAVIVTCLGGGTGTGSTIKIIQHLDSLGISTIVFATMPFSFESDDRQRTARGTSALIEDAASATFILPLDKVVEHLDVMNEAMERAVENIALGVSFFWRILEKPGYIHLEIERLRRIISDIGRGRFASASATGRNRAAEIVEQLVGNELLATQVDPVQTILCGILGGNDLRLSEIDIIVKGVKAAFGDRCAFHLATVNDERTFSKNLTVMVMLFESNSDLNNVGPVFRRHGNGKVNIPSNSRGVFTSIKPTIINDIDFDTPTYLRQGITLDF